MKRSTMMGAMFFALLAVLMCCAKVPGKVSDKPEVINLAYAKIPQASIVQVALGKDFFRAEGLMVNAKAYDFGKLALAAVMAGEADLATVAETPVARAIIGGTKISVSAIIETSARRWLM